MIRILGWLACLAASAFAQEPPSVPAPPTVRVGGRAPALSIDRYVKGGPFPSLEPGKPYVVEFWATWCPACVKSIPHLSEMQKRHRNASLTVIGVAASERGSDPTQKLAAVRDFVTERGEKMAYVVAFDGDRSMLRNWMEAAGQTGIPTAFIVDRAGLIAWVGHPLEMEAPLAQIVAGTWDLKAAAARFLRDVEVDAKAAPLLAEWARTSKSAEWSAALDLIDLQQKAIGLLRGDDLALYERVLAEYKAKAAR